MDSNFCEIQKREYRKNGLIFAMEKRQYERPFIKELLEEYDIFEIAARYHIPFNEIDYFWNIAQGLIPYKPKKH